MDGWIKINVVENIDHGVILEHRHVDIRQDKLEVRIMQMIYSAPLKMCHNFF